MHTASKCSLDITPRVPPRHLEPQVHGLEFTPGTAPSPAPALRRAHLPCSVANGKPPPSLAPDPELLHSFLTTSLASREVAVPSLIPSATCSHGSSSCANLMALLYVQSLNCSLLSSGKKERLSMEYKVIFWGKIYLYFGLCLSFQP